VITIAIVNESTVLSDDDIAGSDRNPTIGVLDALRTQLTRDFCPAWDLNIPTLRFFPKRPGDTPPTLPSDAWVIAILDDSDQADALGYHDVSANGTPLGKVFAKSCLDDHVSWSVDLSHELLEMLADPDINLCAEGADGRIRALEVCDAVEDDSLGYEINGVLVSDFVMPAWFSTAQGPGPFDFGKKLQQPFELGRGGYISIMQAGNWTQINADERAARKRPMQRGSRRERRTRQHRERARRFGLNAGISNVEE
jgi:hypothetical protein